MRLPKSAKEFLGNASQQPGLPAPLDLCKHHLAVAQKMSMDRSGVIHTYGSVWIAYVSVWIWGAVWIACGF
jgi:hypothetical protein